ncbi:3-isopropylmalate dehydratase large subunit [Candidatus Tremblaya phenacola]|uniref:3-isopropylmalate dehydratase n=1 Tax=Candidatus Tremblayella phenacoccinincola TaxID=1010676 RepID=A0A2G0V7B9_9PROT|nr:3-isopropylmalate dehydratase large subunit [Candidatus Tremblaya phenacola]PHN16357.1 3-isopropylmalate dehydratase large subunit 1 [Candidatus Tremblaya phenacola]
MFSTALYDKLWNAHIIKTQSSGVSLLYVDLHLIHEVTSPHAFEAVTQYVHNPKTTLAIPDHNITTNPERNKSTAFGSQIDLLRTNSKNHSICFLAGHDEKQGIVHVAGPELGITIPGSSIVCGDSHTSTHGSFTTLAQGIGSSEVGTTLTTQTLLQRKNRNMEVSIAGNLHDGCVAKDIALAIVNTIGTAGGSSYSIEFKGGSSQRMYVNFRTTLCNMSIEAGAKISMLAADNILLNYLANRTIYTHTLRDNTWKKLKTTLSTSFNKCVSIKVNSIAPQVTWGTSPEMVSSVDDRIPDPAVENNPDKRKTMESALNYMLLEPGTPINTISLDYVFIGSCTNSRIEDLRSAAYVVRKMNKPVAKGVRKAIVVPGSGSVKKQATSEGLDKIFKKAGFEWRAPGCSMCIAMNSDKLYPEERCASTSNRNFEGRQGKLSRTHLVNPMMAALAAISGKFQDVRRVL